MLNYDSLTIHRLHMFKMTVTNSRMRPSRMAAILIINVHYRPLQPRWSPPSTMQDLWVWLTRWSPFISGILHFTQSNVLIDMMQLYKRVHTHRAIYQRPTHDGHKTDQRGAPVTRRTNLTHSNCSYHQHVCIVRDGSCTQLCCILFEAIRLSFVCPIFTPGAFLLLLWHPTIPLSFSSLSSSWRELPNVQSNLSMLLLDQQYVFISETACSPK